MSVEGRCQGVCLDGTPCRNLARRGHLFCHRHSASPARTAAIPLGRVPLTEWRRIEQTAQDFALRGQPLEAFLSGIEVEWPQRLDRRVAKLLDVAQGRERIAAEELWQRFAAIVSGAGATSPSASILIEVSGLSGILASVVCVLMQTKGSRRRLTIGPANEVRVPTAGPVFTALVALGNGEFQPGEGRLLTTEHRGAKLAIELPNTAGIAPAHIAHELAKRGPGLVQIFVALAKHWIDSMPSWPRDRYTEASVADICRLMGRKPTHKGAFSREEILSWARDVMLLSRLVVPSAEQVERRDGKEVRTRVSVGSLIVLDGISAEAKLGEDPTPNFTRFRFHLGEAVYKSLLGAHPQYALAPGRLLEYHPVRERLPILIGVALLFYARANRVRGGQKIHIGLRALLDLAAIDAPQRNIDRFLCRVAGAIQQLAEEAVVPGAALELGAPEGGLRQKARDGIDAARVVIQVPADELPGRG